VRPRGAAVAGLAGLCLLGAAPADPLLGRLLAGTSEVQPPTLNFERSTVASETSGGKTERHTRVDRWDGRAWTLAGIDDRAPTAKEAASAAKEAVAAGVPGYYRLAPYVRAAPPRAVEGNTVVYRLARLPPGAVTIKGANPDKFSAELFFDASGPVPFVRRARYYAPASFRMLMVARVDRFEAVNDYRLGKGGKPELTRQTIDIAGSLFGRDGTQHSEFSFTHR